jgi:hypothetical protein
MGKGITLVTIQGFTLLITNVDTFAIAWATLDFITNLNNPY